MRLSKIIFTLLFITSTPFSIGAENLQSIAFDYSEVKNILVYTEGGQKVIVFPKPLEVAHSRGPAILYRDVLDALSRSQKITSPAGDSKYIMDIEIDGNFKRLYLGDDWISDGQYVSSFEDGNPVVTHIEKRLMVGKPAPFTTADQDRKYGKFDQSNQLDTLTDEERTSIQELELQSIRSTLEVANELTKDLPDNFAKPYQSQNDGLELKKPQLSDQSQVLSRDIVESNLNYENLPQEKSVKKADRTREKIDHESLALTPNKFNWVYGFLFFFVIVILMLLIFRKNNNQSKNE